ncbi:MAG: putative DNA binding domain-containing protein [Candidatus Thiodiazotropha sp. (ex Codakia rugifera)]|nr:putative DNA binding domain-containing protein [Candidatus Thiodiazotropha sp. (ex Codakia rugifera)]
MTVKEQSQDEVVRLLGTDESHFLDFKAIEVSPQSASKTVSAFANASGGEIFIGIDDKMGPNGEEREWRGFQNQEAANALIQTIHELSPLGNHYEATFLSSLDNIGLVLAVTVFKTREIITSSNGTAYLRKGAQKLPVKDDDAIQALKYNKGIVSFENELTDAEEDFITNSETVIDFLIHVVPTAEPEAWVRKQRLLRENRPTVAGIMLLADEPQAILPKRSAIKIFRYKTKEEGERDALVFDPLTIEGPVVELIYAAVDKVKEIIEEIEKLGPHGLEKVIYPEEALHEIITNAVLHRDYSIAADCQIRIYDNRLEIQSPGKLAGHITHGNILTEQFARNPALVRIANKFPNAPNKDVGEGLNTAFESMEKLRLKEPVIQEGENSVLVVLRHESLGSPEQLVMEYLGSHEQITNSTARELTAIKSENTMKEVFYRLRDRGLLEQVPGKKGSASAWRKPTQG